VPVDDPAFAEAQQSVDDRVKRFLSIGGTRSVDHYHRELGTIMWEYCGMARNRTGLEKALSEIPALKAEFWKDVRVLGDGPMNQSLERAGRVADFFELGELMVRDALHREESCGGHFREESQTPEGEALRQDDRFAYVGAWEWSGDGQPQQLHKEPLEFEYVHLTQRSYK
jgi:succinate dehydrogenase / fumarate reductase flavoprotein subunit